MSFNFDTENGPDSTIISLEGKLMEKDQALELLDCVEDNLADDINRFIINLSKLEYMNSSGLNVLVNMLTKARSNGGEVIIANVSDKVNQLLIITKLNTVFSVAASIEEAEKMLNETLKEN
jgi:anti-sigma B factor antagonist